jgi:hypothetical protein
MGPALAIWVAASVVEKDSVHEIRVQPPEGFLFEGWSDNIGSPERTLTCDIDTTLSARFRPLRVGARAHGQRLLEGREWTGNVIEDINSPPKIGNRKGLSLLTYYPDAPLHNAKKYGVAQIQDVSRVMKDLIELASELTQTSDLVVTGDHGYLYLGNSPNKFLWRWVGHSERHGGSYGPRTLEIQGERLATGRYDAQDVRRSGAFIVHGGASLAESLVPVVAVRRES